MLHVLLFNISMDNANEGISLSLSHSLNFLSLFSFFSFFDPFHTQRYKLSASFLPSSIRELWDLYCNWRSSVLDIVIFFFFFFKSFLLIPGSDYFIIFRFPDMFLAEGDKRGRLMGRKAQWLNANQTGTALGSVPTVCAHIQLHMHSHKYVNMPILILIHPSSVYICTHCGLHFTQILQIILHNFTFLSNCIAMPWQYPQHSSNQIAMCLTT